MMTARSRTPVLLYRGPMERSRLALVLDAMTEAFQAPVTFRWLVPPLFEPDSPEAATRLQPFLDAHRSQIAAHSLHDGRFRALPATGRELRRLVDRGTPIVGFQFSAIFYVRLLHRDHPFCWVINGFPEWREFDGGWRDRLAVRAQWAAARLGPKPLLTLMVTEAMGRVAAERLGGLNWIAIPPSTDLAEFAPQRELPRAYITYIGSAAPWQRLDFLAEVWRELAERAPDLRFRVVSRDPEARILADAVPNVDMRSADEPGQVAPWLWEAETGWILREENVMTTTAFPIKFAEYVAADVPVIATDIPWDVSEIIRATGCGLVVPPDAKPGQIADAYLNFRATRLGAARRACRAAANHRNRADGVRRFAEALERTGFASPSGPRAVPR